MNLMFEGWGGELFYSKFLCLIGLQKYWAGKQISSGLLHAFGAKEFASA